MKSPNSSHQSGQVSYAEFWRSWDLRIPTENLIVKLEAKVLIFMCNYELRLKINEILDPWFSSSELCFYKNRHKVEKWDQPAIFINRFQKEEKRWEYFNVLIITEFTLARFCIK